MYVHLLICAKPGITGAISAVTAMQSGRCVKYGLQGILRGKMYLAV